MDCKGTQFFGNTIYMHIFFAFFQHFSRLAILFAYTIHKTINIGYTKINNRFSISTIAASQTAGKSGTDFAPHGGCGSPRRPPPVRGQDMTTRGNSCREKTTNTMKFLSHSILPLLLAATLLAPSCSSDDDGGTRPTPTGYDIYTAGYKTPGGKAVATVWKTARNSTRSPTARTTPGRARSAWPTARSTWQATNSSPTGSWRNYGRTAP